jgi:GGDEF domain-containing protein
VATSRSSRARRFALPDHGDDERTHEAIEAFLEGPEVRQRRPARPRPRRKGYPNTGSDTGAKAGGESNPGAVPGAAAAARNGSGPIASGAIVTSTETRPATVLARSVTDIRTIPGRLEFSLALERESARAARYGRPASVAIVELVPERPNHSGDIWLRSLAGPVARTLRAGSRTTDLVARVANARFQVLLPETPETGAGRFAERVSTACQSSIDESGAPVSVRVTIAVATPDHSLQEALTDALQSIEAA